MSRLDRILVESDAPPTPSGFVDDVMAAVRRLEQAPKPLPFPWAWLGTAVAVVAVLAASWLAGAAAPFEPLDAPLLLGLGVLVGSGLFSYVTVEWLRD
jgi:hypothetical protein